MVARRVRRGADLPHRPLPGQGDGAEPAGLPLRQRHLRAGLEPPLRRPRADHRGRDARRRAPRRLLRGGRRAARHDPEPPAPAAGADRDGAAGRLRGRRRARREGEGAARRAAHPRRATSTRCAVRGQYGAGHASTASRCRATARRTACRRTSATETFAALKLLIDNWRWQGVPFYLRTGKRLAQRVTEIAIQFKRPPLLLFRDADVPASGVQPNVLVMRIQPDEGISLRFEAKVPGHEMRAAAGARWTSATARCCTSCRSAPTRRCCSTA